MGKERAKSVAIIIPALNPDNNLLTYIESLQANGYTHIIVINDGSDSKYESLFDEIASDRNCVVLRHAINMGKGRALKNAFNYYMNHYAQECNGVITADSDGQHTIDDIIKIEEKLQQTKNALVLGVRDFTGSQVPLKSSFGNKVTRNIIKIFYGGRLQTHKQVYGAFPTC